MKDSELFELCKAKAKALRPILGYSADDEGDLATEAWLKVSQQEKIQYYPTYVCRTITRLWIDLRRRDKWVAPLVFGVAVEGEDDIGELIERDAYIGAVYSLHRIYAEVILVDMGSGSLAEGAETLGISHATYTSRLYRARKLLKILMKD